ncbi:MAG: alpha-glucosidase/alpha-galactosidase [Planctomycetota bacterium]
MGNELVPGRDWTVFGPCGVDEPLPENAQLAACPERLRIGRRALPARHVKRPDGVLNIGPLFGGHRVKMTGYVFIPFRVIQAGPYRIGVGADWWFEAWIDGAPILSTVNSGNGAHPPAREDHVADLTLDAGEHLMVVRVISGSAGMTLDVGVPRYTPAQAHRLRLGCAPRVMRPLKIVFIGAGSGFLSGLFTDILNIPGADNGEVALVDIDKRRLGLAEQLCRKIITTLDKDWRITSCTDRRKMLAGADYVICCIEAPGLQRVEYEIPLKYGVDQAVGDTMGPGGLFKGLRNAPIFLDILRDVERLCPKAWVLNYTNPMSILCLAAGRASRANVIGLCHSVQKSSQQLARWCGVPYHELHWSCAGVNHLAWFTECRHAGRDLYPALKKRARGDPAFAEKDRVRLDLMLHFGYYCTESSSHDSEYVPYYRKRKDLLKKYCRQDFGARRPYFAGAHRSRHKDRDRIWRGQIAGGEDLSTSRGLEYASGIIEGLETNNPFVIHGSVMNRGLIANLPQDGVVEVACLVDRLGIRPVRHGALPPQCAALCDWDMRFFDLAAKACVERSREAAGHALMLDPLTAAVCSPAEIKKMTEELFAAEKPFLSGYR